MPKMGVFVVFHEIGGFGHKMGHLFCHFLNKIDYYSSM